MSKVQCPKSVWRRRLGTSDVLDLCRLDLNNRPCETEIPEAQRKYWMSNIREWHALTTSRDAFPTVPRADIQRIKPPVMMLSGGRTLELLKLVDAELEPLLANGERVVLPNSTHEMWAEQPEESRRAVLAFLAKHSQ